MKSTTYALIAVAAIAAFALLREHWSHVAGYFNKISHGTVVFGPGDFSVDDADYFRVHGHGIINAIMGTHFSRYRVKSCRIER